MDRGVRGGECGQQRNRLHKVFSRSHDAVIRVFDESGAVIETHEHKGEFKDSFRLRQ
jgi:hypothetical protein